MPIRGRKSNVLGQIKNPLVFFALALLVIEGIIGSVVAASKMSGEFQFAAVCLMAALFLVVVAAVTVITIRWPRHLYEDIVKDIKSSHRIAELLNSKAFQDGVEDMVEKIILNRSKRPEKESQ